jgi:hypothetical protein
VHIISVGENTLNEVIESILVFAHISLGKRSMICVIEEIKLYSLTVGFYTYGQLKIQSDEASTGFAF